MLAGRPRVNLDSYKEEITNDWRHGSSLAEIRESLTAEYGVKISTRTIERQLRNWNCSRHLNEEVVNRIKGRIIVLYFNEGCTDKEIVERLSYEGDNISHWKLQKLRQELGLHRRLNDPGEQAIREEKIRHFLYEELKKGPIDGFGKQFIFLQAREAGYTFNRDSLFKIYKELNPTGIQRRDRDAQRRKGEYIVPGPNWLWSIDGHMKLEPYGFEIYAAIDAYSRKVLWVYVGISGSTSVSVGNQYLNAVQDHGLHPKWIRSDVGKETYMIAFIHHMLSLASEPQIPFQKCYIYGTSTANQRIESWWQQMSRGLLFRWRVSKLIP